MGKGVLSIRRTFFPAFHFLAALEDNQSHKTFPLFKGLLQLNMTTWFSPETIECEGVQLCICVAVALVIVTCSLRNPCPYEGVTSTEK